MTEIQKKQIDIMRCAGKGYKTIAKLLGISENTVKSYFRRNKLQPGEVAVINENAHYCPSCGVEVEQTAKRKLKRFCSDACRIKWWNSHLDQVNRKANHEEVCCQCGKTYTAYGIAVRKFCSRECYYMNRYGGNCHD